MRKLTLDCIEELMMESEVFWLKCKILENVMECHHHGNNAVSLDIVFLDGKWPEYSDIFKAITNLNVTRCGFQSK